MPHKTKKEKIIAEYRRRLKLLQGTQINTSTYTDITSEKLASTPILPAVTEKKGVGTEEDSVIVSYFKKDFKKSLFLIAIVITLEISLYFVRIIR